MLYTISDNNIDIEMITSEDAVLFWQNGILLAISTNEMLKKIMAKTSHCYVLESDILARGINELIDKQIQRIDMKEVIKLTERYFPQISY